MVAQLVLNHCTNALDFLKLAAAGAGDGDHACQPLYPNRREDGPRPPAGAVVPHTGSPLRPPAAHVQMDARADPPAPPARGRGGPRPPGSPRRHPLENKSGPAMAPPRGLAGTHPTGPQLPLASS